MEWGVVHGWINTLIMGVLGLAVLANSRWRRYRWFVCYALIGTALAVVYKLFFLQSLEFYLLKFLITNLLALGAVVELVRSEKGKEPFWSWGALLCLVVVPFLPIEWGLRLALAPLALYFGQALSISVAVQGGNVLLIGMSVMGLSYFAAEIFKLFSEFKDFWAALRYVDPWFFTVVVSLMVIGIYLPQILKVLRRAIAIRLWRSAVRHLQPVPVGAEGVGLRDSDKESCSVYQFPAAAKRSAQNHLSEGAALRFLMDEILERFDTMEEALAAAATISMSARKTFLSLSDLAVYLGVTEDVAERFVEHRGISKIQLTGEGGAWVVARSSVDAELLEDEEE